MSGDGDQQRQAGEAVSALFRAWRAGDAKAGDALFAAILGELESVASYLLRRESASVSIATGDLVNEAIVKLMQSETLAVTDRAHLLALSARVMRHALIDRVRRKMSDKRDARLVTLTTGIREEAQLSFDAAALEAALVRLARISPDRARLVEMRFFAGMPIDDIAAVLGSSPATVKRAWAATRLWLKDAMVNGGF